MADNGEMFLNDVAEFFNSEIGNDISKLKNIDSVLKKLDDYEEELNSKIAPSTEEFADVLTFDKQAENAFIKISKFEKKYKALRMTATEQMEKLKPIRDHFEEDLKSIQLLENAQSYLKWLTAIENINDMMEDAVKRECTSDMISFFTNFKNIWSKLQTSHCNNLVKYSEQTMLYWHNILKEKFGTEFTQVLSTLHWPMLMRDATSQPKKSADVVTKFKELFVILCDIQLPDDYEHQSRSSPGNAPFLLPFQFMFEPLQKRFMFHFMGKKLTSQIEKPEWYLGQIVTWIYDHTPFMNEYVQPILDMKSMTEKNAKMELMRSIVMLAIVRLKKDLPTLLTDDALLSHTVDSIFLFESELQNLGYPNNYPRTLDVLSTEPCFCSWKALEHKSALDKMDRLLNSETAWKSRYQEEEDLDEFHVPECAEVFITLLHTMTERYQCLAKDKQQIAFMDLQLELLDDFRLRLHQLSQYQIEETLHTKYCAIINALNYIVMVLNEWSNLPIFLKLNDCKQKDKEMPEINAALEIGSSPSRKLKRDNSDSKTDDVEIPKGSVFDEAIALLEHMEKDLLQTLCERVMLDIKAKSRAYRKEKWFCIPVIQDKKAIEVSPLAFPLLDIINSSLQTLFESLSKSLFTILWQYVARELDLYLYEEVILQNSFSEGGAEQLNFDMTRNLLPIFSNYCLKPENYFRLVKESCTLLNLSAAPAMLLKELLKQNEKYDEAVSALAELGVHNQTPFQSSLILSQRNDFNT